MLRDYDQKKRTLFLADFAGEETGVSFVCGLVPAEVWSHALVRAEVAVMLVAVTVLGAGGLNAVRTSKQLLTSDTRRDDDGFAPPVKVRLRLGHCLRLGLLKTVGPELKEDFDNVGSPVLRLLPASFARALLHCIGAGELVAEPRSQ